MIIAHLSDLHLGYRAYGRLERGWNVRERDVTTALQRALHELVRIRPDVVVVAGDVFDRHDPPTTALVTLTRAVETLRSQLPEVRLLMVAGARDTPRRAGEPGILSALHALPGVVAATSSPRSVFLEDLSLHALLLPHAALLRAHEQPPQPDPRARHHIAVAHARVSPAEGLGLDPQAWDYVALGGEHSHRSLHEGAAYSGSLERVDPDPWAEAAEEKGFLIVELPERRVTFHAVSGRAVVVLAPIQVSADVESMSRRIEEVTDEVPGGIDDKIVRLRLQGIRPRDLALLQGGFLARLRRRALHLVVEVERADEGLPRDGSRLLARVEERLAASGADTPERLERLRGLMPSRGP